ncbi:MAG: transposase [Mycobacterium sp.]
MSGKAGKPQPTYTAEFRADAVRLVEQSEKSLRQVAADLGLSTESLRRWVLLGQTDAGRGLDGALTSQEQEELRRLRREVVTLRMEREILKKATAFFAKETA